MAEIVQDGRDTARGAARLGLGTAGLAALDDRRKVWKLLDGALECGIRHFDTARLYGDGTMERTLSPFLKANRSAITITTKFGLNGRWQGAGPALVIPLLRRLAKAIRGRRPPPAPARPVLHAPPVPDLSVATMRRSLETSLRELGVGMVDYFLMHEPRADLISPALVDALESERKAGRIRFYGGGGEWANTMGMDSLVWPHPTVRQVPLMMESPADAVYPPPEVIHSIYRGLPYLEEKVRLDQKWSESFPGTFRPGESLPALLLHVALARNPAGRVLFGSSNLSRIQWTAREADKLQDSATLKLQETWLRGLLAAG